MLIIINGPSGVGKSVIIKSILEIYKTFKISVSVTTRAKRHNEIHGVDYFFVSNDEFNNMDNTNMFFEKEHIFDMKYGTLNSSLAQSNIIFDVDIRGLINIKKHVPNAISIGIIPAHTEITRQRLTLRKDINVEKRISNIKQNIIHTSQHSDYLLINEDLNDTIKNICRIIMDNKKL